MYVKSTTGRLQVNGLLTVQLRVTCKWVVNSTIWRLHVNGLLTVQRGVYKEMDNC